MRLSVLVAYRARPAAALTGRAGLSEYPRSCLLPSVLCLEYCFTEYLIVLCVFPSMLSKNLPPHSAGTCGEQGIRTLDPRLAEPMLWPAELAPLAVEAEAALRDGRRKRPREVAARLQKGGVPAAPSGTATLLRLSPSHRIRPRRDSCPDFRRPRLPWLDGRCVQGPGTYSPRHG